MLPTENTKVDVALSPRAINAGNATGTWFQLGGAGRAAFVLNCGALAKAATSKLKIRQAKDAAADGAKDVEDSEITLTGVTKSTQVTLTLDTVLNTHAVTINGLVFTAHTDTTDLTKRQFAIDGNDTADAAELVKCINDPVYGVPGVLASSAAGVVTLTAVDGKTTITVADDAATITPATVAAVGVVEIDVHKLDLANGFTWVAPLVTNSGNTVSGVTLLRTGGRWNPDKANQASGLVV